MANNKLSISWSMDLQQSAHEGSLIDHVRKNCDPNTTCLIDARSETALSYSQVLEKIEVIATSYLPGRKKLALLVIENSLASIVSYLALLRAGHVVFLISQTGSDETIMGAAAEYSPDLIVGRLKSPIKGYAFLTENEGISCIIRSGDEHMELKAELSLLLTTSGSTGSSKLVRLSNRNIIANAYSIRSYLGLLPDERAITTLPLSYSYGLSILHSHLVAGASFVLTDDGVTTREFWQAFKKFECSSLAGVPYTHQTLLKLGIFRTPPASLRYVTQAGGRLDPAAASEINELLAQNSIPLFIMYGQTEATARIAFLSPEQIIAKAGSIGKAIPGGELSVVSESGILCPPREIGEIVYSGPNVMMGYAESRKDLSRGDDLHGTLHTGDLGYYDEEGFFYITGRKKRIAKILGIRISLDEIEALMGITDLVAAIERNERIICFHESIADERSVQLHAMLCEKLSVPSDYVEFRKTVTLPRKHNGKFDYQKLEAL